MSATEPPAAARPPAADGPSIAVVICTRDRPRALRRAIESVCRQTRPPAELIVVDDGCLAPADLAAIREDCNAHGIRPVYVAKSRPGLTASRNLAAAQAGCDVLLFLDDDVTAEPDACREIADLMRDPAVAAVALTVLEPRWADLPSRVFQAAYRLAGWWRLRPRSRPSGPRPEVFDEPARARPTTRLSGAAMAIRREVVLAQPFDEQLVGYGLGEDREMGYRLAARYWMVEALRARVVHHREAAAREPPRQFGFMTAYNYLYILRRTGALRPTDGLIVLWTFLVLAGLQALSALFGDFGGHVAELRGLGEGVAAGLRRRLPPLPISGHLAIAPLEREARPLSVAFVTNRLEHGGAEWMLLNLCRRLPAEGIRPVVFCLKDGGPLADLCRRDGFPLFDRLLDHKTDVHVLPRMRRLLLDERIDAAVAVGSGGDRMFWTTLAARPLGRPVVVWSHWCPTATQRRFEAPNRLLYRWVDCFVALGQRHRDALVQFEHVPAGRTVVIPNGIDLARFERVRNRSEARRRLGLSGAEVAIGIVANLRPEKRHDVFIEAAERVAAEHHGARFFIIGDGPSRAAVRARLERSPLAGGSLRWLGARDDVPVLLAGLDLACLCSEVEALSLTMLEAAAAGCAIVAPDCGSLDEFLADGQTGLTTRPADAASLAAGLRRLLADGGLRRRLAAGARERVEAFRIEGTAARFARLLRRLVADRRGAGESWGRSGALGGGQAGRKGRLGIRPADDCGVELLVC